MSKDKKQTGILMHRTSIAAVIAALFFIFIKGIAFICTDSVAVLSSLFDSIQDLLTSGISLIAIRQSIEPPDKEHRFGHGKAQGIGAMIQSFIIFTSALILLKESVYRLFHPQPFGDITCGLIIMIITLIITILLVLLQRYTVRQTNALSVRADMAHYSGDILMNTGVICTLIGNSQFGWYLLDGIFGIIVSFYLIISIYYIVHDSYAMLMDAEMPHAFRRDIRRLILSFKEVRKMTDLRTRLSGSCIFIQLCIQLNPNYSLKKTHQITEMIEKEIKKKYPVSQVLIHVKPYEVKR